MPELLARASPSETHARLRPTIEKHGMRTLERRVSVGRELSGTRPLCRRDFFQACFLTRAPTLLCLVSKGACAAFKTLQACCEACRTSIFSILLPGYIFYLGCKDVRRRHFATFTPHWQQRRRRGKTNALTDKLLSTSKKYRGRDKILAPHDAETVTPFWHFLLRNPPSPLMDNYRIPT